MYQGDEGGNHLQPEVQVSYDQGSQDGQGYKRDQDGQGDQSGQDDQVGQGVQ